VPRADVFGEFMWPLDPEDFPDEPVPPKHETPESAEAALAFLVEQEMVEVAGDTITVPARFWSGGQPPAPPDPTHGTTSVLGRTAPVDQKTDSAIACIRSDFPPTTSWVLRVGASLYQLAHRLVISGAHQGDNRCARI
jgi:hypothetical protein